MSFVDDYTLSRSSVFKTLIGLFIAVAFINIIVVRQVYIDSENFHRKQLTQHLNKEVMEFSYLIKQDPDQVDKLLRAKQASNTPFYYRLLERTEPSYQTQYYPISTLPRDGTANIAIGANVELEIGIHPHTVDAYRKSLIPIVFSGIVLPIAVMLVAALFFTLLILRRLETVNKAMNRVLCGERDVKLSVSTQDDEFDILSIHLNYMIEQITKNEQTLKSLTVGMAHDMRTPMARLKLRLEELLSQHDLSPTQVTQFSACHDELELILSLFNSMLEIAKLNSGQMSVQTEQVNLTRVSQDAIEFIAPIAEQKQLNVSFRSDNDLVVKGDPSLLFRAIFNLIENAVKYTPERGSVDVVVDQLGVVIADSGVGISDQDKPHVCRPMYRADKSRSEHGNGLGLSLVDAVVNKHNARLILKDNHPGLRARIYFPY